MLGEPDMAEGKERLDRLDGERSMESACLSVEWKGECRGRLYRFLDAVLWAMVLQNYNTMLRNFYMQISAVRGRALSDSHVQFNKYK